MGTAIGAGKWITLPPGCAKSLYAGEIGPTPAARLDYKEKER